LWSVLPRTLPYLRPYWKLGALSTVLMIAAAVATLAQPWPLAIMLDVVSGHQPREKFLLFGTTDKYTILAIAVAAGFLLVVAAHSLTVINSYIDSRLEQNMILDLRSDLFDHAQRLSLTFHDSRQTGELMARINYAAASLGAVVMSIPPIAQSVLTLIGMAVIAMLIDWKVTLISLGVLPLMYYSLTLYGVRIVPRLERVQTLEWQSLSMVNEAMAMLRVIVPFSREAYEHQRFRDQGQTAVDERVRLTVRQTAFNLAVTSCTAVGTALVFYFGFSAEFRGEISIGQLLILLSYIAAVYAPLEQISSTIGALHQQFIALNSSFALLDTEPEVKERPDALDIGRARGAVSYQGVGFSYDGRPDVLCDVSFDVEPGTRVAIVGPTGAGKTTLLSLLVRFYDPKVGQISIDGVDIRALKLEALRSQVSVVLQEPMLFSGTIASNIRYGRLNATDVDVVEAAKAANAHDFIVRLPAKYDTELGERGAQLSGGERQRIAVARAFLKDAPLLVLDEPTSSIDSKTEEVILDALDRLVVGRTSFMVAHRLSTIRDADLILVMNRGQLVERGTHEELLEGDGLYRQLHEAQSARRRRKRLAPLEAGRPNGSARGEAESENVVSGSRNGGAAGSGDPTRGLLGAVLSYQRGADAPLRALAAKTSDRDQGVRAVAEIAESLLNGHGPAEDVS
jgi:ABC-type multidrug transport system fused ATPase/permease subunit